MVSVLAGIKRSAKADVEILQAKAFAFFRRDMETPLTPVEFARRARKIYPERIAVIESQLKDTRDELRHINEKLDKLLERRP